MRIEVHPGTVFLLEGERRVAAWLWGFREYAWTANRRMPGRHGFTVRLGSTLVIVTLPGKGYVRDDPRTK